MEEKSVSLEIGDSVRVREGTMDPDFEGICIEGWQGRVWEITKDENGNPIICIQWDSITLKNMPGHLIERSEEEGLDYTRMWLGLEDAELAESRDAEEDAARIIQEKTSLSSSTRGGERITGQMTKGKCHFCDAIFSKGAMTNHLKSCKQRKAAMERPSEKLKSRKTKSLHLVVEGSDLPEYWMHLSVPAGERLDSLDDFLRDIWLECCGHLSAFTIQGIRYSVQPMKELGDKSMKVVLGNILKPGMKFNHEYDFGTTTALALREVSELEGEAEEKGIQVLARNEPPYIACECGKTATQVCAECIWSDAGWLCDECAGKHECGEDMLLSVVNSPRVGMCGYTG